ncbi:sigma-70 family RNA polymerase sigma factor [Streptomyces virginiae]|uniref:sigma-70 family RNA polymerase sigma factor n=1 Tax=Streptomyces virginiae TaxID=1961 RepID=UPI0036954CD2
MEYVAFHSQNHVAYLKYAHLELGPSAAQTVVEDVFTFLLEVWPDALKEENLQAFAWAQLREHVERHRAAQVMPTALVDTVKYAALRRGSRRQLELIESRSGVYGAIAELPDRHYDVVMKVHSSGGSSLRAPAATRPSTASSSNTAVTPSTTTPPSGRTGSTPAPSPRCGGGGRSSERTPNTHCLPRS